MPRRSVFGWALALALTGLILAGCAGGSALLHPGPAPAPNPHAAGEYLARLSDEQSRLAQAERSIPVRPRTPAALSHAISLLAGAIHDLAAGLSAIRPPGAIARLHQRLVAIARRYHDRLATLAPQARQPESEVAAANSLAAATSTASTAFTATFAEIRARLTG